MEEINYDWLLSLGFYKKHDSLRFDNRLYSFCMYRDIIYKLDDENMEVYHTFDLYIVDYESDNAIHWPFHIKYKNQLLKIFDAMEIKLNAV